MLRLTRPLLSMEAFCLSLGTARPVFYVKRAAKVHAEAFEPKVVRL